MMLLFAKLQNQRVCFMGGSGGGGPSILGQALRNHSCVPCPCHACMLQLLLGESLLPVYPLHLCSYGLHLANTWEHKWLQWLNH